MLRRGRHFSPTAGDDPGDNLGAPFRFSRAARGLGAASRTWSAFGRLPPPPSRQGGRANAAVPSGAGDARGPGPRPPALLCPRRGISLADPLSEGDLARMRGPAHAPGAVAASALPISRAAMASTPSRVAREYRRLAACRTFVPRGPKWPDFDQYSRPTRNSEPLPSANSPNYA